MPSLWVNAADTVDPTSPSAEWAVQFASFILYKLTGEKYRGTTTSVDTYVLDSVGNLQYAPYVINGDIENLPVRNYEGKGIHKLYLRGTPVIGVDSIMIDGEMLNPSEYRLVNNAYLVRNDRKPWLIDDLSEVIVTYRHGTPPPNAGKLAALRLANELIWADTGDSRCALPQRVTNISRQGVSATILDPQDFLENGKTGIYVVDLFIKAANPSNAKKKPKVFSPDKPSGDRRRY
jgi:hypothetical protein